MMEKRRSSTGRRTNYELLLPNHQVPNLRTVTPKFPNKINTRIGSQIRSPTKIGFQSTDFKPPENHVISMTYKLRTEIRQS